MIIKMKKDHHDGWLFRDGVKEVQTYKMLDTASFGENQHYQIFKSLDDLVTAVGQMWGSFDDRERGFATELWPDWPTEVGGHETTAVCLRAVQANDSIILVVAVSPTYLLGDDGRTIERLK